MPASQPANFNLQEFTDAGLLLVGGRLYTYNYGTTAQKTAYTDPDGTVPHTYTSDGAGGQYIALNARGELPAPLYLTSGSYDLALKRADGSTVWTRKADGVENFAFIQAATGAVARTVPDKLRDTVSVKDFGAKGDGATDDSAAFTAALAAGSTVVVPFGTYLVKNVDIGTNRTLNAGGAIFKAAVGASYMFRMNGFRSIIRDAYFEDSAGRIPATFQTNAAVIVEDAIYPEIHNSYFVNMATGLLLRTSANDASHQVTKGTFTGLRFDTIARRGIYVGQNVNTCTFTNMRMYVGSVVSNGKEIPKAGCIGFQIASTGSANTYGGHMLSDIDVEQAEYGFQFTDAQLSELNSCFADSVSGSGYQFTGTCDHIKVINCLAGTCLVGYEVSSSCTNISLDSVNTVYNGVVPPWGDATAFFNAGAPYDIAIRNSAKAIIGSWMGDHKVYVDATASLQFENGDVLYSGTANPVAAGSTIYFGPGGSANADVLQWVAPRDGVLYGLLAQCASAPGAGQSFSFSTRISGVVTGLAAAISGAAMFEAKSAQLVTFTAGQNISVGLATSAGAAASTHRLALTVKYF